MNQPGGLGTGTPRPVRGRRTLALHKAGTQPVGTQAARRPDSVHPLPAGTFQERPPGGPRRPDRMDPAGPFGVLLLPLLLMGTALGDGGAGAPGIGRVGAAGGPLRPLPGPALPGPRGAAAFPEPGGRPSVPQALPLVLQGETARRPASCRPTWGPAGP